MARQDIHRPSAINPAEYTFVAFNYLRTDDLGAAMFLQSERAALRAHMARTGGTWSGHEHGGNCDICGSVNAIYTAAFHHAASNKYIKTGLDCAEKLDCAGIDAFKKKVTAAREAQAGKRKAKAILEDAGLLAAWELREAADKKRADFQAACKVWMDAHPGASGYEVNAPKWIDFTRDEYTALDITSKLVKYGSVSDKALNFLGMLLTRIAEAPALAAKRAAEAETTPPVPEKAGRWLVEGEVISIKSQEGRFGFQTKVLIKHADGWKLWGTLPAALADVQKGAQVSFVAAVERSDKDKSFGFFSRPAQAKIKELA